MEGSHWLLIARRPLSFHLLSLLDKVVKVYQFPAVCLSDRLVKLRVELFEGFAAPLFAVMQKLHSLGDVVLDAAEPAGSHIALDHRLKLRAEPDLHGDRLPLAAARFGLELARYRCLLPPGGRLH